MRSTAFSRSGSKVMRSGFFAIGFAVAFLIAANAQAANSWGLPNEEIVRLQPTALDLLCEPRGACPAHDGAAPRHPGLPPAAGPPPLRTAPPRTQAPQHVSPPPPHLPPPHTP